MRRILSKEEFSTWLQDFLPTFATDRKLAILVPVEVSDVTDGKIVHLAGLDLSRAWCFLGIASALDDDDPRKKVAMDAAAPTGLYFVTHSDQGHAFHYRRKGSAANSSRSSGFRVRFRSAIPPGARRCGSRWNRPSR